MNDSGAELIRIEDEHVNQFLDGWYALVGGAAPTPEHRSRNFALMRRHMEEFAASQKEGRPQ